MASDIDRSWSKLAATTQDIDGRGLVTNFFQGVKDKPVECVQLGQKGTCLEEEIHPNIPLPLRSYVLKINKVLPSENYGRKQLPLLEIFMTFVISDFTPWYLKSYSRHIQHN